MKRRSILLWMVEVCVLALQCYATPQLVPPYTSLIQQQTFDFYTVVGSSTKVGEVTSTVYEAQAGGYIYVYQIANLDRDFSWFSVGLSPVASVVLSGYDDSSGGINPDLWKVLAASVEASFFTNPIGVGETSSLLWFTSPDGPSPDNGIGSMSGYSSSKGFTYAEGTVFTPAPEPITMVLLGAGWLALRPRRRKN